jgi:uridine phosphorylase
MTRAWYTGHAAADLADCAILVGDPDRIDRLAALLDEAQLLPVKRGLRSVTGLWQGVRVSAIAFGMGAPIATIVLHEFAALGLRRFLRIGTAMHFPPAQGGDFLISDAALPFDGTSVAYGAQPGLPVAAAPALCDALAESAARHGVDARRGLYATFDAFYRDMFGIDPEGFARADATRARMRAAGVIASDMETAALLAAARALGAEAATLCLGTVDALTQEKLGAEDLRTGEDRMFRIALDTLARKGPALP